MLPGRPTIRAAIALAAIGTGALAGCGDGGDSGGLASLAPPDAPLFAEAVIRPGGDRAEAITSITDRVAGITDPGALIVDQLDSSLAEDTSLTYQEDIDPWLGEEGAFFIRSLEPSSFVGGMTDGAYMVETTDADAAQGFIDDLASSDSSANLESQTYEGVDYELDADEESAVGLVNDFMVAGTEASFKAAVDASQGESLAESESFSDEVGDLDDDKLAELWVDVGVAFDAATQASGADGTEIDAARAALGPLLEEPVAVSLAATPDTVTLDTSAGAGTGLVGDTELLGALPADSWFGLALDGAGDTLRETFTGLGALGSELGDPRLDPEAIASEVEAATGLDLEDDLLSWVGDAAAFVSGTSGSTFAAAAILGTSDPEASSGAIAAARDAFEAQTGQPTEDPRLDGADDGFAAEGPNGRGLEVAQLGDRVIAAFGGSSPAAEAVEPSETLLGSERFDAAADALGGDYAGTAYLALQDFLVVAEKGDDEGDIDYEAARPYLDALDYMILGTGSEEGRDLTRVVVGFGE